MGGGKFNFKLSELTGKILKNTFKQPNFKPFKDNNGHLHNLT